MTGRHRRVATEETRWVSFWARGFDDFQLRRRRAIGRWLVTHNRLRGFRLREHRATVAVAGERDKQAERDREYLRTKET